ncbi:hypothetical protein [Geomonas propionica]|uniref:Uncharacterized protein n=1 Tax=Geomonas propionica TaxID=2798582 RepID=A0ABS0YM21_9BACT|nr:hypothetical protein [Geomonas propionica]MBJ6799021.1 hypothetical protein [Geomonas propionica]
MSDLVIVANSTGYAFDGKALIKTKQRQLAFFRSKSSALVPVESNASAGIVSSSVVDVAEGSPYGYSAPRRVENIADTTPLPLPAPTPMSYSLQARLAYEGVKNLEDSPQKILSISI